MGRGHKDKSSHREGTDQAKGHISRDPEQRDFSLQETGPEGQRVSPLCPHPPIPLPSLREERGEGRKRLAHKPEMFPAIKAPWRYG